MSKKIPLVTTLLILTLGLCMCTAPTQDKKPNVMNKKQTETVSQQNENNMKNEAKEKVGLLVTMTAKVGQEQAVKEFLLGGLSLVNQEPGTESWFAFQIDDKTFGIYDTFEGEEGRQAHLSGEVAKALMANAETLLDGFDMSRDILTVNITANRLTAGDQNKGLLVMMKAKEGMASDVEGFLQVGKSLVADEPNTVSWYAFQLSDDTYAIFDTFAADTGRDEHLNGKVAEALMANAPVLLDGFDATAIQKIDILASK